MKQKKSAQDGEKMVSIPMSLVNEINHSLFEADLAMAEYWYVQEKRFAKETFTQRAVLWDLTNKIVRMNAAKKKLEEAAITQS